MAKEPKTTTTEPEPKTDPNTIPPPGDQASGIPVYEQSEEKDEGGEPDTAANKAGKKNPADKDEDEDTASS